MLEAWRAPRVVAIVARRTRKALGLLSILTAAGVAVSTVTRRQPLDAARADVVVVCGATARAAIRLVGEVRAAASIPVVLVVERGLSRASYARC